MVKLSKPFYLSFPIVNSIATIFLAVAVFVLFGSRDVSPAMALLVLGFLGLIYASVVMLILFYQMWKSVKDNYARTSPGRAVGFLFIPFFNFYWIFQVLWGFSKDYNSYAARNAISSRKLPEGLFLAWTILQLASAVPYLNIVAIPVYWIVSGIGVSRICDAVNALAPGQAGTLRLHFLSGEFMNDSLEVPPGGLYIGRDAARANLIFNSNKISALHVHLAPNPLQQQLWVEDLNSLNGTFYLQGGDPGDKKWARLTGKMLLTVGARLRLADDVAELEIRKA
ncbi:MAG TPA: FHA domain-containing protein [Candidatus Angelobacter sp.]|jgi:hypothetical protein|nr:FHA domain-containing protein [Candidatus Angelobacter sp.]